MEDTSFTIVKVEKDPGRNGANHVYITFTCWDEDDLESFTRVFSRMDPRMIMISPSGNGVEHEVRIRTYEYNVPVVMSMLLAFSNLHQHCQ